MNCTRRCFYQYANHLPNHLLSIELKYPDLFLPLFDLIRFISYYFVQAELFHANLRFQKEKNFEETLCLCTSQFHLRPAPPPPRADPRALAFFWPWMANSRRWGLLSCQIPWGEDGKRGQMSRPPSSCNIFH